MLIHSAIYSDCHQELTIYMARTAAGLQQQLAARCQAEWAEQGWEEELPSDPAEAIEMYFDDEFNGDVEFIEVFEPEEVL